MTPKEAEGYHWMKGAMRYLSACVLTALLLCGGFNLLRLACGWGMDDTDKSRWVRSGLAVYTDAKTGVQYLSDRHGGLVRRAASQIDQTQP